MTGEGAKRDMASKRGKSFGEVIREKRLAKGYSLRKFAELIDVSPTYLSLVEQNKVERPPRTERVRRMAEVLGENPDELAALAGRVLEDLPDIINRQPTQFPDLLREASGLTPEQLKQVREEIRKLKEQDRKS